MDLGWRFDSDFIICNGSIISRNCPFGLTTAGGAVVPFPRRPHVRGGGNTDRLSLHQEGEQVGSSRKYVFSGENRYATIYTLFFLLIWLTMTNSSSDDFYQNAHIHTQTCRLCSTTYIQPHSHMYHKMCIYF